VQGICGGGGRLQNGGSGDVPSGPLPIVTIFIDVIPDCPAVRWQLQRSLSHARGQPCCSRQKGPLGPSISSNCGSRSVAVVLATSRVVMVLCSLSVCKSEGSGEFFGAHIRQFFPQTRSMLLVLELAVTVGVKEIVLAL